MSSVRALIPEKIKHAIYRAPRNEIKRIRSLGVSGYFFLERWQIEMERSVASLPRLPSVDMPVDLWFLTGSKFWYQTAYCAWTFGYHASRSVKLRLIDDGTLEAKHIHELRRLFGDVDVLSAKDAESRIKSLLPDDQFPTLNLRWQDYIHLRKLIDVHLGQTGPKLVLDSDMLFFGRPSLLLDWLDNGLDLSSVYMTDCIESYGYSRRLLTELAGTVLPEKLNVGICGLRSETIDWSLLEMWCSRLREEEGTSYFLEQALVAMMAARSPGVQISSNEYITLPTLDQIKNGEGILQHYVASSKANYFRHAWRIARSKCGV